VQEKLEEMLGLFGRFLSKARAVRRLGSAALDMCYVAAGRLDGFWEEGLNAWDIAGGVLIVQEAAAASRVSTAVRSCCGADASSLPTVCCTIRCVRSSPTTTPAGSDTAGTSPEDISARPHERAGAVFKPKHAVQTLASDVLLPVVKAARPRARRPRHQRALEERMKTAISTALMLVALGGRRRAGYAQNQGVTFTFGYFAPKDRTAASPAMCSTPTAVST
jgi:hypothetical protein